MTAQYYLTCSTCDHADQMKPHYGFLDSSAAIMPLVRPLDYEYMKQLGYTENKAAQHGRLFECKPYVCEDCGTLDYYNFIKCPDVARISPLMKLALAAPLLMFLFFYTNLNHGLAIAIAIAFSFLIVLGKTIFLRVYLKKTDSFSDHYQCKKCSSPNLTGLTPNTHPLPCPECGQKTYTLEP